MEGLNIKQRIRLILRKYPESKYSRGKFTWHYAEEFYGVKVYALKHQWISFFTDYSSIERAYRDILKESEFKLPPEMEAKRYEKDAEFKNEYKKPDKD